MPFIKVDFEKKPNHLILELSNFICNFATHKN
jgi:hypothetical protein